MIDWIASMFNTIVAIAGLLVLQIFILTVLISVTAMLLEPMFDWIHKHRRYRNRNIRKSKREGP